MGVWGTICSVVGGCILYVVVRWGVFVLYVLLDMGYRGWGIMVVLRGRVSCVAGLTDCGGYYCEG